MRPRTTVASGRCTSPPVPVPMGLGTKPKLARVANKLDQLTRRHGIVLVGTVINDGGAFGPVARIFVGQYRGAGMPSPPRQWPASCDRLQIASCSQHRAPARTRAQL